MPSPSASTPSSDVTEIILKVHSRCNLACSYCYVYELEDKGWEDQPRVMSLSVADQIITRAREYGPGKLRVIFHGGEPLLAGVDNLRRIADLFRASLPETKLQFGMQSNGTLLTPQRLSVLRDAGFRIGVSFDGDQSQRPYRSGRSSHDKVTKALGLLKDEYREAYGGILTVVNPAVDPVDLYSQLAAFRPPSVDFLLPLATYDSPPPAGCGEWLVKLFEHWKSVPDGLDIRLFRVIIERLLGRDRRAGFLGPPPDEISVVFQPDGSAELADALTVVGDGVMKTGMNARDHSLAEIAAHPGFTQPPMCATCANCRLTDTCGGGFWVTRVRQGSYDNPSVYCEDLMLLIDTISAELKARGQ